MKTQPCLCAVDVECTVRVQSRKLLIETIMLWLGGQPRSPPGVGESKTGDNKGTFLPRSPWLLIFLLWDRVVVAYTLYVWHPSLPSHLWQIFLVWKIPQQKHKFTPLPNSVPQLPPTTKAPPPLFFSLPNQEACTGNSCPSRPPACLWPGASWERSDVWPSTCGWHYTRDSSLI